MTTLPAIDSLASKVTYTKKFVIWLLNNSVQSTATKRRTKQQIQLRVTVSVTSS